MFHYCCASRRSLGNLTTIALLAIAGFVPVNHARDMVSRHAGHGNVVLISAGPKAWDWDWAVLE